MKQIFPKEIIENTSEVHEFENTTKSKIIYLILLTTLLSIFIVLPLLKVTIYTSARGIIKPNKERILLNVINSGQILYSNSINNKRVYKGDTLLIMDNNGVDNQLEISKYQLEETALFVKDLTLLLSQKYIKSKELSTSKYQREYIHYEQKIRELNTRFKKAERDFVRHEILYEKQVISKVEFEDKKFDYDLSLGDTRQFKKQQMNSWQANLIQYKSKHKELMSGAERLIKSKNKFVIKAPISGTLLHIKSFEKGSFVTAGTQFGEISPDTKLLVECYVSPSDIGLLKTKNKIKFQIDAYNYNQWGMATGVITEIGNDIELVDNQAIFKVRCMINEEHLKLKNGFMGNLKKGMTLNANFKLTERSLFDLLYDKMDDWLNPRRIELTDKDT